MSFMSNYVPSLFLFFLTPMGYIIGLALGALILKYVFGFIHYYFKLANIIHLTVLILFGVDKSQKNLPKELREKLSVGYALSQAATNFKSLALNDFTTRGIVMALKALKNAILNIDLMSRFKEPKSTVVKFVKSVTESALGNVINMTDEMIVSYTWFAYDVYLQDMKSRGKEPTLKQELKNRATFMLEGLTFIIRTFPSLLVNSLVIEVGFIIVANAIAIGLIVLTMFFVGFNFAFIFIAIILYRTIIQLIYYTIIESFRLTFYLYSFYSEMDDLEPFDITDSIANLVGKVPLLKSLVKQSGLKVEPTGMEGDHILEGDMDKILVDNVKEVANAFNLNTNEILKPEEPKSEEEEEEAKPEEQAESEEETKPDQEVEPEPKVEDSHDLEFEIEDDFESEPEIPFNPFADAQRVTRHKEVK